MLGGNAEAGLRPQEEPERADHQLGGPLQPLPNHPLQGPAGPDLNFQREDTDAPA